MVIKLLHINLQALFVSVFMRGKKRSGDANSVLLKFGIVVAAIYVFATFGTLIGSLFTQFLTPFYELGFGWMYFTFYCLIVFSICVITCIFTAQAQIFNAKDNELLLVMPIKPSAILLARVLTLLVIEYVFAAIISIPVLFVWISGGYATTVGIIFFVIEFLFLPLLALAVACLLAWILTLITSRMRKKNIITLIVSIAFLGAYFFLVSNMQGYIATLVASGAEIADALRRGFPPLFHFGRAISESSIPDLLIFLAFAVIPFAIMIALLSHSFVKVATTKRGAKKIEYRERSLKAAGHIKAINKIELRRYWSSPGVIMNTSLGGIFAIIVGGYLLFAKNSATVLLSQLGAMLPGTAAPAVLVGVVIAFTASMSTLSAALISLEGKRLWIVRSMPIHARDILLGKLVTHLEISALPALLGSILSIIALSSWHIDIVGAVVVFLLPQVFILATGALGLILNLHMPKFDWINELQPVKQSLPIMLVMFGTMTLIVSIAMLYFLALKNVLSITAFALLLIIVLAIVDLMLVRWIISRGADKFDSLNA